MREISFRAALYSWRNPMSVRSPVTTSASGARSLISSTTRVARLGMWYCDPQCRSEICAMTIGALSLMRPPAGTVALCWLASTGMAERFGKNPGTASIVPQNAALGVGGCRDYAAAPDAECGVLGNNRSSPRILVESFRHPRRSKPAERYRAGRRTHERQSPDRHCADLGSALWVAVP